MMNIALGSSYLACIVMHYEALVPAVEVLMSADLRLQLLY